MTSCSGAATFIVGSGTNKINISNQGQRMGLFRFALGPRRNPPPGALLRGLRSASAEVREDPQLGQVRLTLYALAGLFIALLAVSDFMQLNRVVTSTVGQIVTTE